MDSLLALLIAGLIKSGSQIDSKAPAKAEIMVIENGPNIQACYNGEVEIAVASIRKLEKEGLFANASVGYSLESIRIIRPGPYIPYIKLQLKNSVTGVFEEPIRIKRCP